MSNTNELKEIGKSLIAIAKELENTTEKAIKQKAGDLIK